jgi:hypothetical protein
MLNYLHLGVLQGLPVLVRLYTGALLDYQAFSRAMQRRATPCSAPGSLEGTRACQPA